MTLVDQARAIVENDRHAGHNWRTVYATLEHVRESGVNEATARIRELRDAGIPRWLVRRWAADAGLVEPRHSN